MISKSSDILKTKRITINQEHSEKDYKNQLQRIVNW